MNMVKSNSAKVGILQNVQILIVDNDLDSRDMYTFLLEELGANVTTTGSIKEALNLLDWLLPDILITETVFLGESIDLLIQKLKDMALTNGISIPMLVTSTCSTRNVTQYLKVEFKAYLQKPIYLDDLVSNIWRLLTLSPLYSAGSKKAKETGFFNAKSRLSVQDSCKKPGFSSWYPIGVLN